MANYHYKNSSSSGMVPECIHVMEECCNSIYCQLKGEGSMYLHHFGDMWNEDAKGMRHHVRFVINQFGQKQNALFIL